MDGVQRVQFVSLPDLEGDKVGIQPQRPCMCCRWCCVGIIITALVSASVLFASILQVSPVWPLRILAEAHCQLVPPEVPAVHELDRIAAMRPRSGLAKGIFGINLPPQQGTSYQGNFLGPGTGALNPDGSYNYEYTDEQIEAVRASFDGLRIGFNVYTARNATAVAKIRQYFDMTQGRGGVNILALWDTIELWETCPPLNVHGNGRVNNVDEAIEAWTTMYDVVRDRKDILLEVFNEPFGYWTVPGYLREMHTIIHGAGIPHDRVVLSGVCTVLQMVGQQTGLHWLGNFSDGPHLLELSSLGWDGAFSYHHYPEYVAPGHRTVEAFAQKFLREVLPIVKNHKVHISEIGASLRGNYTGQPSETGHGDINSLLGFEAGLRELRAHGGDIASAHWWFGMGGHANDTYNVFSILNGGRSAVVDLAFQVNRWSYNTM